MAISRRPLPGDPAWLRAAFNDLGLKEVAGKKANPRIVEMFAEAGFPYIVDDETAWCAAAAGSWLASAGQPITKSLAARSYLDWGKPSDGQRGDVVVFTRGSGWQGHVAFVLGILLVPLALGAFWERAFANATYDGIAVGPHRINCRIRYGRLLWLYATNVAGVLLTLGLFYPWALIRRIRYQFECMSAEVQGSLDEFAAAAAPEASATGEAIGEVFDVDFGF